jgi:hypothetical protein
MNSAWAGLNNKVDLAEKIFMQKMKRRVFI